MYTFQQSNNLFVLLFNQNMYNTLINKHKIVKLIKYLHSRKNRSYLFIKSPENIMYSNKEKNNYFYNRILCIPLIETRPLSSNRNKACTSTNQISLLLCLLTTHFVQYVQPINVKSIFTFQFILFVFQFFKL